MDDFEPCPVSGRLPAAIDIRHEPRGLLGRYFLWADHEARERGVTLSFGSLDELVAANRANADTWRPLVPIFDPEIGGVTIRTGFALIGRAPNGEIVATQAARVYEWPNTTLEAEASSLRMFYADPAAAFARGDRCDITTPVAREIGGRVVFSGAGWYRPDFRGRGLVGILPRISRAYAFARWNSDYTISMMGDAVVAGGVAERAGHTNIEPGSVKLMVSPLGAMSCALVWMKRGQLLSDLDSVMSQRAVPEARAAAQ